MVYWINQGTLDTVDDKVLFNSLCSEYVNVKAAR